MLLPSSTWVSCPRCLIPYPLCQLLVRPKLQEPGRGHRLVSRVTATRFLLTAVREQRLCPSGGPGSSTGAFREKLENLMLQKAVAVTGLLALGATASAILSGGWRTPTAMQK